jgi:hypothetical protein
MGWIAAMGRPAFAVMGNGAAITVAKLGGVLRGKRPTKILVHGYDLVKLGLGGDLPAS